MRKVKGIKVNHLVGSILLGAGIGLLIFSFVISNNLLSSKFKAFVITSGSMEPAIKTGSVVFTRSMPIYSQGDIITFNPNGSPKDVVTHRIIAKIYPNIDSEPIYYTTGDANKDIDTWKITNDHIVGKVTLKAPYLGYIVDFAKTPKGFVILIVIPATIIIYEEIKALGHEVKRKVLKTKPKKHKKHVLIAFLFPLTVAALYFVSNSNSFFFDFESSSSNVLSAATQFGSPSPSPTTSPNPSPTPTGMGVVINEVYYYVCTPASTCGNNPENEWIELYNNNSSPISLDNWTITDNHSSDTIPTGTTIQANSFVIITKEQHTFDIWNTVPVNQQVLLGANIGNGLTDGGDRVILKNHLGQIIDQLSYDDDIFVFNPAIPGVARGHSIERSSLGVDTDSKNDFVDKVTPSPGS